MPWQFTMEIGTAADGDECHRIAMILLNALASDPSIPTEGEMPGANSLIVYALMSVAGRVTASCGADLRGAAIEAAQEYYAAATQFYAAHLDAQP